jgi:hypothetical protein
MALPQPLDAFNCRDANASEIRHCSATESTALAECKHPLPKVTVTGQPAAGDLPSQGIGQREQSGSMSSATFDCHHGVATQIGSVRKFGLVKQGVSSSLANGGPQAWQYARVCCSFLPMNVGAAGPG